MPVELPSNLHVSRHPCLRAKLSQLRSNNAGSRETKRLIHEITTIIACEALAENLGHAVAGEASTPLGQKYPVETVSPRNVALIPILRSGLSMVEPLLAVLPDAVPVYHLGLFREKTTLQPVEYYNNLPDPGSKDTPTASLAIILAAYANISTIPRNQLQAMDMSLELMNIVPGLAAAFHAHGFEIMVSTQVSFDCTRPVLDVLQRCQYWTGGFQVHYKELTSPHSLDFISPGMKFVVILSTHRAKRINTVYASCCIRHDSFPDQAHHVPTRFSRLRLSVSHIQRSTVAWITPGINLITMSWHA
ncbi:hypothetical protein KEM56_002830 [Ascosphaera pollenicola]|nr:hypothetical protein KEM56_002830 [Ascosphaera pollenicola]